MVVYKRKKNVRQRGSHTHGYGSKKKHRGAGHRGGRGNAGSGKRADAKKPSFWKNAKYFGSYGFTSYTRRKIKAINISEIEKILETLLAENKIEKEKDTYVIDLSKLGYQKLLGRGKPTQKLKIKADIVSKKAQQSIEQAGGNVIVPNVKKE